MSYTDAASRSVPQYVKTMNAGEKGNILTDLGITSNQYAYASNCFSVAFIAFEIPSNIIVKWSYPRESFFPACLWSGP